MKLTRFLFKKKSYDSACMWNLKDDTNELNRNRLTHTENKLMLTKR